MSGGAAATRKVKVTKLRRILSIDGGGIKGVIPAAFLATVEESTGLRIVDHFDMIAGTSTGGIIALGLGLGLSAQNVLDFYLKEGPRIFDQEVSRNVADRCLAWARRHFRSVKRLVKPKYRADALEAALTGAFGLRCLGESQTRLLIPAFDAHRREVYVFKTAHSERFMEDWKVPAIDVALATAAAPTYFPTRVIENGVCLLDGGLWANNPVGLVVVEALGVLDWPRDELYVLSLGCGEEVLQIPDKKGAVAYAWCVVDVLMLGQSRAALGTAKLLTRHSKSNPRLYRYNQTVSPGSCHLDSVDEIATLRSLGVGQAREALPDLVRVFFKSLREEFTPYHGRCG